MQTKVVEEGDSVSRNSLVSRERIRFKLLDKFWNVWREHYLRGLPATVHKFYKYGDLQVGSVVLIREDNVPRMRWEMGVVTELIKSRDDVIRSAVLHTPKGSRTRAIQRLHNLELLDDGDKVLKGDCAPKTDFETMDTTEVPIQGTVEAASSPSITRFGRIVKPVQRLGYDS